MSGRTSWADGFIAVDWGTTNRRAYLIGSNGKGSAEFEDGCGILSVGRGEFEGAIAEIRERLGPHPLLLAGMVGSNRGWVEAPYVPCPAGVDDMVRGLVRIGDDVVIVPGVSLSNGRCDVMRGEEVQLAGAIESGEIPADCLVCHPGTHNKWVEVAGGRIASFRTVMTGELFSMLKHRSILSDLLSGWAKPGGAFRDGVRKGLSGDGLTAELFEVRASFLLGRLNQADGASLVSGLLIGEDLRVGLGSNRHQSVIVMGSPKLTALYSAALEVAGAPSEQKDGEAAFIAGAKSIVERLK
jgi:2-dehydro-3-deoxygalactonokinase